MATTPNRPIPGVSTMQAAWREYRRAKSTSQDAVARAGYDKEREQASARQAIRQEYNSAYQAIRNRERAELDAAEQAHNAAMAPLDDEVLAAREAAAAEVPAHGEAAKEAFYAAFGSEEAKVLAWLIEHRYDDYTTDVTNALRYVREHQGELILGQTVLDLLDAASAAYGWCNVWPNTRRQMIEAGVVTDENAARKELLRQLQRSGLNHSETEVLVARFLAERDAQRGDPQPGIRGATESASVVDETTPALVELRVFEDFTEEI